MKTFETTSTPAMEPWKGHTSMSPAQQLHHHRVLTCLLFDPALERREREVATDKAVTVTAQQARRDRLLLVEALKEQHKQQLAEEVAMMNKRVEETQVLFVAPSLSILSFSPQPAIIPSTHTSDPPSVLTTIFSPKMLAHFLALIAILSHICSLPSLSRPGCDGR